MAKIRHTVYHASGIPLGGIGTGSVEIRPDGHFHEWQIFNLGRWAPRQPECCRVDEPEMPPGALSFFVRVKREDRAPVMRRLGARADRHNLYSFAWLRSVGAIDFDGRFPVARLTYYDGALPVAVEAEFFSPFTPHDARTSGTPGFHAVFRVRNRSSKPVDVSLLGFLRNPLLQGAEERKLENTVTRDGEATFVTMRTLAESDCPAAVGSMSLAVAGGEASWIAGDFPEYLWGYGSRGDSPYGTTHESALRDFRETGRLPSLESWRRPAALVETSDEDIDGMSREEKEKLLAEVRQHAFAEYVLRRVLEVEPGALDSDEGLATYLKDIRARAEQFAGRERKRDSWGDAALASKVRIEPLEEREIVFVLGWHFPNHLSERGPLLGHMYENWFKDAEEVARFLAANFERHRKRVTSFSDALFDTNLPQEMADAWAGQLTTIPKCTWWIKNGDFGVWEGIGCCGFHTTDITYQGSFNLIALFPELEKRQMEMGARFQREDGRVHHFFTPDLAQVDNGFNRVDMNQQFVLLAARDYLWTADKEFLARLWPHIIRAMDNTAELDTDGDGLPDHDTRRNTYDNWNFFGTPSYIASLWLSALLAGVRLAEEMGDEERAKSWRATLEKGAKSFDEKLWNGEYYSLWVAADEKGEGGLKRDECCMTDQIDGEWFTELVGLGHVLPDERIAAALGAVMRHNFSRDDGLMNATYPPGSKPVFSTYRNVQAMAPWTGIEYAIASMMMDFGLVAEGYSVVKAIHERYTRAGRFWDHVECGDHYYRAMSSWAVLLAATGFKLDLAAGRLTIAPKARKARFRAPWVSSTGWGVFETTGAKFTLECRSGAAEFKELRLGMRGRELRAFIEDEELACSISEAAGLTVVAFEKPVRLAEGDSLVVG